MSNNSSYKNKSYRSRVSSAIIAYLLSMFLLCDGIMVTGRGCSMNKSVCTARGYVLLNKPQPISGKKRPINVSAEIRLQIIGEMDALTGVSMGEDRITH